MKVWLIGYKLENALHAVNFSQPAKGGVVGTEEPSPKQFGRRPLLHPQIAALTLQKGAESVIRYLQWLGNNPG